MMRRWEWRERRGVIDDLVIRREGCRMGSEPWGWLVFPDSVRQVRLALPVLRIPGVILRMGPEPISPLSRLESWRRLKPVFGSILVIRPPRIPRSFASRNGESPDHPVGIPSLLNSPMYCWSSVLSTEKPLDVSIMLGSSDWIAGEINCFP